MKEDLDKLERDYQKAKEGIEAFNKEMRELIDDMKHRYYL